MSDEPVKFRCYRCGKLLGASSRRVGAVVPCPQCGSEIQVPEPGSPAQSATSAAEPEDVVLDLGPDSFAAPFPATDAHDPVLPPIRYDAPGLRQVPSESSRAPDVILPPAVVLAWSLLALIAVPLAFLAGLLVGHFLWK